MELTMKRSNRLRVIVIIATILCLIPISIVVAAAFNQPTIGMAGVNNSDLTVGMSGVNNSDLLLDYDASDWHISPSDSVYPIMIIVPLVFFAVGLLLLIQLALSEDKSLKNLIYAAVLIIIALSMLAGIQFNINSFLGG